MTKKLKLPRLSKSHLKYYVIGIFVSLLLVSAIYGIFSQYLNFQSKLTLTQTSPTSKYALKIDNKNSSFESVSFADRQTQAKGYSLIDKYGVKITTEYVGTSEQWSVVSGQKDQSEQNETQQDKENSSPTSPADGQTSNQIQNTNDQNSQIPVTDTRQLNALPITSTGKSGEAIVTYKDIEKGVDLRYTTTKGQVKEEVIINTRETIEANSKFLVPSSKEIENTNVQKQDQNILEDCQLLTDNCPLSFSFLLKTEGLTYTTQADGTIDPLFTSIKDSSITYAIPEAYMYDSKGSRSDNVKTIIKIYEGEDKNTKEEKYKENENTFIITLIPDTDWLNDPKRQFPIIIDPTLVKGNPPVMSLNFDEGVNDTCSGSKDTCDGSGNSNHGEITAALWQKEDLCVKGKCLLLDGTNDYVTIADNSNLNITDGNSLTISAWVKFNSLASGQTIIAKKTSTAAGDAGYILDYNSTSGILELRVSDGVDQFIINSKTISSTNTWMHIEAVYVDNDATASTVYINGVESKASTTGNVANVNSLSNALTLLVGTQGNGNSDLNGFVDGIKIYNYTRTSYQARQDYLSKGSVAGTSIQFGAKENSLSSGLVGYWKMDETVANSCGSSNDNCDASGNNNNGDWTGTFASTAGKYGNAAAFDGSTTHISIPDSNSLDLPSSYTVSTWVKWNSITGARYLLEKSAGSFNGNNFYMWWNDTSFFPNTAFVCGFLADGSYHDHFYDWTPTLGQYYQITCQLDDEKNLFNIYINGDLVLSENETYSPSTGFGNLIIGRSAEAAAGWFNGSIDELRIYNRALSEGEIKALYNYAPEPVGYWKFDEGSGQTILDASGNNNTGQVGSSSGSDANDPIFASGKFGNGLNFDGSDDYVTISDPGTSTLDVTGEITISAWVYKTEAPSGTWTGDMVTKGARYWFQLYNIAGSEYPDFYLAGGEQRSTTAISRNTWTYLTVVYSDASDSIKFYINGVATGSSNVWGSPLTSSMTTDDTAVRIGWEGNYDQKFGGIIDDVKIYNYVRSQAQIIEDMNGGHPVGGSPVGSQVGYWKFDEGYGDTSYDWSPQIKNGDLSGSTTCPSSTICPTWSNSGKFGKGMYFGGLQTANGDSHVRLTNDVYDSLTEGAISLWFKPDDAGDDYQALFGAAEDDNGGLSDIFVVYTRTSTNGVVIASVDNGTPVLQADVSNIPNYTSWHHIVFSVGSSGNELYLDGVKQTLNYSYGSTSTNTWFNNVSENTTAYTLGCYDPDGSDDNDCWADAALYQGYMDDVKVYSTPLTADQVKTEYLGGVSNKFGSKSTTSAGIADDSKAREYCVPGDTSTCNAPIAEWKFDEASGTSAYDTSGNNLTISDDLGTSVVMHGKKGKARAFDNTTGTTMKTATISQSIGAISASAWVYARKAPAAGREIESFIHASGPSLTAYVFWLGYGAGRTDISLHRGNWASNGRAWDCGSGGSSIVMNQWNQVGFTTNGAATDTVTFYINGKAVCTTASNTTWGAGQVGTTVSEYNIGGANGWSSTYYDGLIDDMRIYDYVRTPAQFAWEYNRGAPRAWYKFDECTGVSVSDWSPNANNGYNTNTGTLSLGSLGVTSAGSCTVNANTAWYNGSEGKINASLDFDGSDDYVSVADSDNFSFGNGTSDRPFSVSAWVKMNDATDFPIMNKLGTTSAGSSQEWLFGTGVGDDYLFVQFFDLDSSNWIAVTTSDRLTSLQNQWTHVTMAYDGSGSVSGVTFFVNGQQKSKSSPLSQGSYTSMNNATGLAYIGALWPSDSTYKQFADGQIDDVRVFGYTLTPQQVKDVYNNGAVSFR